MKTKLHNEAKLKQHVLALSTSKEWDTARKEWCLTNIRKLPKPGRCPCGHNPITYVCEITNTINGRTTNIGNVCIQKFMSLETDIFSSAMSVIVSPQSNLSARAIEYAQDHKLLSEEQVRTLNSAVHIPITKPYLNPRVFYAKVDINNIVAQQIIDLLHKENQQ